MAPRAPAVPLWKEVVLIFLPSFVAFLALDVTWISLFAGAVYKDTLGEQLRPTPDIVSGLLAWCFIVGSVQFFTRVGSGKGASAAFIQGAAMGAALYGCYEFTNLSVLAKWTWSLALTDLAWGTFVCGVAAVIQNALFAKVQGR